MLRKDEPPIDVALNKSTGAWEVPRAPKHQLKPWQRLWFAFGTTYLLLLAGSYYMLVPNQQCIEKQMVFSITEEVKRYDGMAFAGEPPGNVFETARSQGYVAWIAEVRSAYKIGREGKTGFERIDKEYRDAISELPTRRKLGLAICLVAWMLPMSAFYAIGLVVDWIRRGHQAHFSR